MKSIDALGRRRRLAQNRGLRSLFPKLPQDCRSRLLRIAMSQQAWDRLDSLVATSSAPTQPRAYGELLERLLARTGSPSRILVSTAAPTMSPQEVGISLKDREDWQAWQIQKELALLASSAPEHGRLSPSQQEDLASWGTGI
jgi:hypothetical protein